MKGKILLGVLGLLIVWLIVSGYLNLSTVNSAIETATGIKTVSVNELKQMAEEGKIPYEVYRFALYKKLENPNIFYRIMGNKVYLFLNGSSGLLEGRYVEKINDTWLRVVIVDYDDLFANRYYSVRVDVSTELKSGYIVNNWFPSYIRLVNETKGKWKIGEVVGNPNLKYKSSYGNLIVKTFGNPNPEDRRLSMEIAEQMAGHLRCCNRNDKTDLFLLTIYSFNPVVLRVWNAPIFFNKSIEVLALDGDKLVSINLNKSDSLMKSVLLDGRGNCYIYSFFTISILNSSEIPAYGFVYPVESMVSDYHEEIVIPYGILNFKNLEKMGGVYINLYTKLNAGKECLYVVVSPDKESIPLEALSGNAEIWKYI